MRPYRSLLGSLILGTLVACSSADAGPDPFSSAEDGGSSANGGTTPGSGGASGSASSGGTSAGAGAQAGTGGIASTTTGGSAAGGAGATAGGSGSGGSAGAGASGRGGAGAGGSSAGSGGSAGSSTASGGSGVAGTSNPTSPPDLKFPSPSSDQMVSATIEISGDKDAKLVRYIGTGELGSGGQDEGQDPIILLKPGATLRNAIIGAPAADGIHCEGSCTLDNVWWEDVGEDAITLQGKASDVYIIRNSGARKADDKVIQHNGGGTLKVTNFLVQDFGKLWRSCGNCSSQTDRHAEFDIIVATGSKGILAGLNQNYNDTAKFKHIFPKSAMTICERYQGNDTGAEPSSKGKGADDKYCLYSASDIMVQK